ncbi:MAG: TonB-dependent receptor [Gammaproteobacteria bacterium]
MRSFIALAVLLLPLTTLNAADSEEIEDTIIVTGSRAPIELGKAGASVTIIDRERIEARRAAFVTDLLREVPGMTVSRAGGPGKQTQVRVRGAEGNHVMVLIDGIEVNDLAGNDEFDFGHLTTADIERIEIVRGPQSALWGSDALAGVINIITRKSDTGFSSTLMLEGGSFATNQQRASAAFGADDKRLRVAVSRLDTGGINIARSGDEDDGYRNVTVDVNGGLRPLDNLDLAFVLRSVDTRNETDSDALTGTPSDTPGMSDNNQLYLGTRGELTLLDGRWIHRVEGNWSSTDIDSRDPAVLLEGETSGDRYEAVYQTTFAFTLDTPVATAHRATFAVDHEYQRFRQRGPVSVFGDPNQTRGMHNTGFVGEYRLDIAADLSLGGSVRHDENSDFKDVTTYRGSATWRLPVIGSALTLAYGTGQKAPTFLERFGFATGGLFGPTFIGNAALEPETSRGWEVGLAHAFLANTLRVSATWFSERLRDEIFGFAVDPTGMTATAVNQNGTSRRDGLELTLAGDLPHGFVANASYTYLDATELDRTSGLRKDEVRRPNHQGSIGLDWRSDDGRWQAGAVATHTGSFEDIAFLPPLFSQTRIQMGSYTLLGITGSYTVNRALEVYARVDNALDEHYEELFGYRTPGIAGYVGVRLSFSPD